MDIDRLTIGQVKELKTMFVSESATTLETKIAPHDFEIGKDYFIRSVTHHYLGRVVAIHGLCVVLADCAWIADDGKFSAAMRGDWTDSAEHEPYPKKSRVSVYYSALCDAVEWEGELISKVK